ncbi:MAG: hypothetical protein EPO24_00125 [Bacteroidetes bacterium]|nr:MAG: hypothetical protein EPO24_00125 [Bacteroidota bacterium]
MVKVALPTHLRVLASINTDVELIIEGAVTTNSIIDAIEARYPMLRGTIRSLSTQKRQPFIRFYAHKEDLSHESPDVPLPEVIASGKEPFLIVGAIAGG